MNHDSRKIRALLTTLPVVSALLILCWLLSYTSYGFDFTDEGYYLQAIAQPWTYDPTTTQFSFVYHALYNLLDGDLVTLRQINVVIIFSLALLTAYIFFALIFTDGAITPTQRVALSVGFASSSLLYFNMGVFTPSHNSLNFKAILMTSAGVLAIQGGGKRAAIVGAVLVGVGGWLVFMAKPPSAALLALAVLTMLLIYGRHGIAQCFIAAGVAVALLLLSALTIDISLQGFIDRILRGIELAQLFRPNYSFEQVFRIDDLKLNTSLRYHIVALAIATMVLGALAQSANKYASTGALTSVILIAICVLWLLSTGQASVSDLGKSRNLLFLGLPLGMLGVALFSRYPSCPQDSVHHFCLAPLLLVMPYIYAFGHSGNYWRKAAEAGFLWALAVVALFSACGPPKKTFKGLLVCTIFTQAATATLIMHGLEHPHRQPAFMDNRQPVIIGEEGQAITLSEGSAQHIAEARRVASSAGFIRGSSIIDLSGQSPGLLFSLGAAGVGQAWTIGGYEGSEARTLASLIDASCDTLANSWLLIEEDGPRSLSPALLKIFGADLERDYVSVGSWETGKGSGGYQFSRTQRLFKPSNKKSVMATCEKIRAPDHTWPLPEKSQ